jgi:transposase
MSKKKQTKTQRINALLVSRPELTAKEIAKRLNVSPNLVHQVKWQAKRNSEFVSKVFTKVGLKKPSKIVEAAQITKAELKALLPKPDPVNHPPHYKAGGIETIDFIEAKDLNYRLGNVIKYVSRAGRKDSDPVQDLEKAAWYLNREIAARKRA